MEGFSVRVTIKNPIDPGREAEIELLVNTRATLSWVPRELVSQLDLPCLCRRDFVTSDGQTIQRDTAAGIINLNGKEAAVPLVAAEAGDLSVLGQTALESLGFRVDPINQQLIPQPLLAMHQ